MTEKFKIVKDVSSGIIFLTFLLAFLGLTVYSFRGIVKDNFESIYFFIGTAITLSGFTMLGGIFGETRNPKKEKFLFFLSILFLVSAFSFILFIGLYSGLNAVAVEINSWSGKFWIYITIGTYYLGIGLFFFGFAILILVLLQHYYQIDASPEVKKNWWQFWKT